MPTLKVSNVFTTLPGGRFIKDGPYSGELFRNEYLFPALDCLSEGEVLTVDLDGGYGYGNSFIEEAFGGAVRLKGEGIVAKIMIISKEEPPLIDDIKKYMYDAVKSEK